MALRLVDAGVYYRVTPQQLMNKLTHCFDCIRFVGGKFFIGKVNFSNH
ncbi:MAG: hypothetical protein ACYTFM_10020 [Planctomycetota bacterium]|jgi:hypothetical protein